MVFLYVCGKGMCLPTCSPDHCIYDFMCCSSYVAGVLAGIKLSSGHAFLRCSEKLQGHQTTKAHFELKWVPTSRTRPTYAKTWFRRRRGRHDGKTAAEQMFLDEACQWQPTSSRTMEPEPKAQAYQWWRPVVFRGLPARWQPSSPKADTNPNKEKVCQWQLVAFRGSPATKAHDRRDDFDKTGAKERQGQ